MAKTTYNSLKIPPQNIDGEKALLGSILIRPDSVNEIIDLITPDVYYADKHRTIYKTMLELVSKGEPIDLLTLSSRLKEKNQLEIAGGASYLGELVNSVPSSSHIRHYADLIHNKFMLRNLIGAAEYISGLGYDEEELVEELLDKAQKRIYEATNASSIHKFVELKDILGEAWERMEMLHQTKGTLGGVPTGFKALDDMLSGFQKSDLIILAARPSMGKTSLALDIARQTSTLHNVPVGIFSLEMSSQQLTDRMLAAASRVDAWSLRTGNLKLDEEFARVRDSLDQLSKAPIFIDDQPGNNFLKMRAVARRLKSERGLGLIVVDYLQLMVPHQARNIDSMVQQVTEISRSLKTLARELDVPVLALSQLSRAVEQRGGKPRLSDLRDSGSIEQDADVVMFIHREDKYKEDTGRPGIAEIMIEKHRNGATGKVELFFDEKKATFLSIEKSTFGALDSF
jgi:replicative DNA helicase